MELLDALLVQGEQGGAFRLAAAAEGQFRSLLVLAQQGDVEVARALLDQAAGGGAAPASFAIGIAVRIGQEQPEVQRAAVGAKRVIGLDAHHRAAGEADLQVGEDVQVVVLAQSRAGAEAQPLRHAVPPARALVRHAGHAAGMGAVVIAAPVALHQLAEGGGVGEVGVVDLQHALHPHLPVGGPLHRPLVEGADEDFRGMAQHVAVDAQPVVEIRPLRRHPQEDEAAAHPHRHRRQGPAAAALPVQAEIRLVAGDAVGHAVAVEGPAVIAAAQHAVAARRPVDQGEAVGADIAEAPQLPVEILHQHVQPADAPGEIVVGPGEIVGEAGEDPAAAEDPLLLRPEDLRVVIGGGRDAGNGFRRSEGRGLFHGAEG